MNEDILIRLREGDAQAFEILFWKYNERVYRFIQSLLYDKTMAEDLTQSVFLKIWEKRETIDPAQGIDAYLFTIARNLAYKETRERLHLERLHDLEESRPLVVDHQMEERMDAKFLKDHIDRLIEELPPSRREIFQLSREQHLSYKEIANRLNISEKTVETQIYRTLQFLRSRLSMEHCYAILWFLILNKH